MTAFTIVEAVIVINTNTNEKTTTFSFAFDIWSDN